MPSLTQWLETNPGRIKKLHEDRIARLERTIERPKHLMDASEHYKD